MTPCLSLNSPVSLPRGMLCAASAYSLSKRKIKWRPVAVIFPNGIDFTTLSKKSVRSANVKHDRLTSQELIASTSGSSYLLQPVKIKFKKGASLFRGYYILEVIIFRGSYYHYNY